MDDYSHFHISLVGNYSFCDRRLVGDYTHLNSRLMHDYSLSQRSLVGDYSHNIFICHCSFFDRRLVGDYVLYVHILGINQCSTVVL